MCRYEAAKQNEDYCQHLQDAGVHPEDDKPIREQLLSYLCQSTWQMKYLQKTKL